MHSIPNPFHFRPSTLQWSNCSFIFSHFSPLLPSLSLVRWKHIFQVIIFIRWLIMNFNYKLIILISFFLLFYSQSCRFNQNEHTAIRPRTAFALVRTCIKYWCNHFPLLVCHDSGQFTFLFSLIFLLFFSHFSYFYFFLWVIWNLSTAMNN